MEIQEYIDRQRHLLYEEVSPLIAGTKYCIPDPPMHENKGDTAIFLGEVAFMEKLGKTLSRWDDEEVETVLLHGGGNFGDIWRMPHFTRLLFIKIIQGKRMIMCPQTVHYKDKALLKSDMELLEQIVGEKDITFLVRDQVSYDMLLNELKRGKLKLTPDMAFLNTPVVHSTVKYDIVVLARSDHESHHSNGLASKEKEIRQFCEENGFTLKFGDWLSAAITMLPVSPVEAFLQPNPKAQLEQSRIRTQAGLEYLAEGKVILTDRLHGHILASLLGRNQVLLDNSYGKISNYVTTWKPPKSKIALVDNLSNGFEFLKNFVISK